MRASEITPLFSWYLVLVTYWYGNISLYINAYCSGVKNIDGRVDNFAENILRESLNVIYIRFPRSVLTMHWNYRYWLSALIMLIMVSLSLSINYASYDKLWKYTKTRSKVFLSPSLIISVWTLSTSVLT